MPLNKPNIWLDINNPVDGWFFKLEVQNNFIALVLIYYKQYI